MRAIDLIRKKRDGEELSREEIDFFVGGYTSGDIADYQAAAWLMAALLRGLTHAETAALTEAMLRSGEVLNFSDLPGRKIDKHSTGGVGDKTSLLLAPLAAAAGLTVPMISGRGLGHTGGTLDKLEAIPGFNVKLSTAEFRHVLEKCGCAMIGQTAELAPADGKLYALRDVTGTVESPFLICASIMSKKLAEGIDGLVLDVKTGSGAFMKKEDDAIFLAKLMVETGERMGTRTVALITDMDQPLGNAVGNSLEVEEIIAALRGEGPPDLLELCMELAAQMLVLGAKAANAAEGRAVAQKLIRSGAALEKFREMVLLQGGSSEVVEHPQKLPKARHETEVSSQRGGYVQSIECESVGKACVILGGGRERKEDAIDPAVGLRLHKKVGDKVAHGEPVCTLLYNSESRLAEAKKLLESAYQIGDTAPCEPRKLIRGFISSAGSAQ